MAIDQQALKDALREVFGNDGELYALAEQKLMANDKFATDFMAGYMRNRDYTQKTQAIADERRTMEDQKKTYETQLQQYREAVDAAESGKAQVLRDLANHKESLAGAYERLKNIKQMYALSDEDIPSYSDLIKTEQKGKPVDNSNDLDERFNKFEQKITKLIGDKLIPELGGMARLDTLWPEIRDEHEELTGKKMNARQMQELLDEASARHRAGKPTGLKDLWEEKYNVGELRQKHHDDGLEKRLRQKWDDEQKVKLSEAALQGISPVAPEAQGFRTSNILQHKFKVHEEPPAAAPKTREATSSRDRQAATGGERAAQRFLERRANGIPMGAPDERKASKVA